jgi:hypothetical protein
MSIAANDTTQAADRLEHMTSLLDELLILMALEIGPIGMQARVAGRVLVAQLKCHGRAPE